MIAPELIIAILVGTFWIINMIAKARKENEANEPEQKANGQRPGNELDRFLQEIDRFRRDRSAAAMNSPDEPTEKPATQRPVIIMPQRPVILRPPVPVLRAVVEQRTPVLPVDAPQPATTRFQPSKPEPARAPRKQLPAIRLLKSPESLITAMVLQEVLGPPKCRANMKR